MAHSSETTVHMIGNAHIDPVWLWPCEEGRREVVATYRTAIDLIAMYDAYVFTSGGTITYKWVEEDDPELYRAIVDAVKTGQWSLVNGWWLQPDCNIPHGEAFARHALYGQRYLLDHFGKMATVGYNVDSFGHAGTLPQILRLSGLDEYLFFRPGPHEKDLPAGPFWWEAPDGSRVLTCRPPLHYNSPEDEDMRERVSLAAKAATEQVPMVICFYGVGNHGGGPTKANIVDLVELMEEEGTCQPVFSSPDRFFSQARELGIEWPVVHDDLQHHSPGCYTALSRVKRENRQSERMLMQAERLGTLANVLCGAPDIQSEIDKAWEPVLFNQFHDILAGTSIHSAYDEVWSGYDAAKNVASAIRDQALETLTAQVAAVGENAFVAWNTLAWTRDAVIAVDVPLGGFRQNREGTVLPTSVSIRDESGNLLPAQIQGVEFDDNRYIAHVLTRARVPALGWKTLYVEIKEEETEQGAKATTAVQSIENQHLQLVFDPETGGLVEIRDKATDTNLLAATGALALVIDDPSDTWSHDVVSFNDVMGTFGPTSMPQLTSASPAASCVSVKSSWGNSTILQEYTLADDSPVVDIKLTIDWHEELKMLKLGFPLNINTPQVTASAPYGAMSRKALGEEDPCQAWVDLSDERTGNGITFINSGSYGYDVLDNEFRLSILRSPIYAFHQPRQIMPGVAYHYTDQGKQVMHVRLLPHIGPAVPGQADRADCELHEPIITCNAAKQMGAWAASGSVLRCEPENVTLTVLRENNDGTLIVRGFETAGQETELVLHSAQLRKTWKHQLQPFEIWTLRLDEDGCEPLDLLDRPLMP